MPKDPDRRAVLDVNGTAPEDWDAVVDAFIRALGDDPTPRKVPDSEDAEEL
jgi:hypothetical protein